MRRQTPPPIKFAKYLDKHLTKEDKQMEHKKSEKKKKWKDDQHQ